MLSKEIVQKEISLMPDQFEAEELIEKIIFMKKYYQAKDDIKNGRVTSHSDVIKETEEWFK